jgi:hypothetical protein
MRICNELGCANAYGSELTKHFASTNAHATAQSNVRNIQWHIQQAIKEHVYRSLLQVAAGYSPARHACCVLHNCTRTSSYDIAIADQL